MTSPTLIFGSILLAFSPSFSLLVILVSQKPQLVILAVCSAFAYLLSALLSSVVWLITSAVGNAIHGDDDGDGGSALGSLFALAIPGVLCQMIVRCLFVRGYFKVEDVIRRSVAKHEEETAAANNANNNNNNNNNHSDADAHAETDALQLQLNDLSCSLASGCGYALLHSLFLYGTLLASESGEGNGYVDGAYAGGGGSTGHGGTLYQESCGGVPGLVNGALIACMFSVMDVAWMMLCFHGMRRREERSEDDDDVNDGAIRSGGGGGASAAGSLFRILTCRGLDDDAPSGGNATVAFVAVTHLAASLVLAPNAREDGCRASLPALGAVTLWVLSSLRGATTRGRFLPEDQRRRIRGMQLGLRDVGQGHHVE